nr:MAG TPA: hypothetical protein [Bacteriophage sp.]
MFYLIMVLYHTIFSLSTLFYKSSLENSLLLELIIFTSSTKSYPAAFTNLLNQSAICDSSWSKYILSVFCKVVTLPLSSTSVKSQAITGSLSSSQY